MDGFPRDKINATANLKNMIISQLQAPFGPVNECQNPNNTYTTFDVIIQTIKNVFVARGIVYLKPNDGKPAVNDHRRWRLLREARSEKGVMDAMESDAGYGCEGCGYERYDGTHAARGEWVADSGIEMRLGDIYEFR